MRYLKICLIFLYLISFESHADLFGRHGFFQKTVWDNFRKLADGACNIITTTVEDVIVNPIEVLTGAKVNIVDEDMWITVKNNGDVYWGRQKDPDFRKYYKSRYEKSNVEIKSFDNKPIVEINNKELQEVLEEPLTELEELLNANTQRLAREAERFSLSFKLSYRQVYIMASELVPIVNQNKELAVMERYLSQLSDTEFNNIIGEKPITAVYPEEWIGLTSMAILASKLTYKGVKVLARELFLTGTISAVRRNGRKVWSVTSDFLKSLSKFGLRGKDVAHTLSEFKTITSRVTKKGLKGVRITRHDGSIIDINPTRVKEVVPVTHPLAPAGKFQNVKFSNPRKIPGLKIDPCKRDPTKEELALLEALWKKQ